MARSLLSADAVQVQAPEGAARVDLTGKTVMPGIIEAHAHLGYWKDLKPSAEHFTRENLLSDLQRLAYHGVTAVLSMGADRRDIAWPLRDELAGKSAPRCGDVSFGRWVLHAEGRTLLASR